MTEPVLTLKPGREKSVLRRHPWIFSGAVARVEAAPEPGETVIVRSAAGDFLARAAFNPQSQIVARIWSWEPDERVDSDFVRGRLLRAIDLRRALSETTNALRWVNAESDGLPGLIVDRYAGFVVCQFLTAGAERWKEAIAETLAAMPGVAGVYERSDVEMRGKEGLKSSEGPLRGATPPRPVEVWESDVGGLRRRIFVDIHNGHKTGFYLDQRDNRPVVARHAHGGRVLNVFAYTGAFTVCAWQGGAAEVISVDSSGPALELARKNCELNGNPVTGCVEADAFKLLREYRDRDERFDLIVLDPPKFAHTESQIDKATRAYKDLNWLAFRLLNPGGHLVTFSCSGLVSEDLFQMVVFGAALDAGREAQIVQRLGQAGDHPVLLSFPQAAYLKGFVCRVM